MRAISLFSGGLDSMLAIKLITSQGVDVTALHIFTGFGATKDIRDELKKRAKMAGADFLSVDVREEYIQKILFDPVYGYGKNFNPCIDCHGYMFKIAKKMLKDLDASFLVTGEVVGQRPMSQRKEALEQVRKLAEDKEKLILRPLSAKLLEPTTPEIKGWVDREKLLDISGRSRERQLAMAKEFGWEDYESPAGGCLLTEPVYSQKIREFIEYEEFSVEAIELLKYGRHFRLEDGAKLIVGRDKDENIKLQNINHPNYTSFRVPIIGPTSLVNKNASIKDLELAAKIAITYAKSQKDKSYRVKILDYEFDVTPFESKTQTHKYLINKN
ncbi:MAG: ATP-binding protein [Epsilonproteobacteria bacterium]|nr:ATP-binding protein [Campylobacterota bacterium]